ncbi:MAG: LysR family transcriptional regulator [Clostridia bacterium]|nr:LysR family transcriptional regulator [Clostridia bacterium]
MDFRQLEVFMAVVELSSFSRAGEKLFLSQPTVSSHISALEKELQTPLLIRSTREVYPSEAGQRLYEYATRLLRLREEAVEAVSGKDALKQGMINVAASTIPAKHLLPELISGFLREHQGMRFNIIPCDSSMVNQALISGEAKIGISGTMIGSELCRHYPIARDKLVLITPDQERFAQIALQEDYFSALIKEPFIMRPTGSGTRYEFEQYLSRRGFHSPIHIVAEMADTEAIKNSVAAGLGISVISERAAAEAAQLGLLRIFPLPYDLETPGGGERFLYLLRRKKDRLSERERMFFAYVLSRAEKGVKP